MSRAGLASKPEATPRAAARRPIRVRSVCRGRCHSKAQSARQLARDAAPVPTVARQRPSCPAKLDRQTGSHDLRELVVGAGRGP